MPFYFFILVRINSNLSERLVVLTGWWAQDNWRTHLLLGGDVDMLPGQIDLHVGQDT